MGLDTAIVALVALSLSTPEAVDPLSLVPRELRIPDWSEQADLARCDDGALRSVRILGEFGLHVPDPSTVDHATDVARFLRLPPCETDVDVLDHWLNPDILVFDVVTGDRATLKGYVIVQDARGEFHELQRFSPDFAHRFHSLFWDADERTDDYVQGYASLFIKLLELRSATSFLPSYEVAEWVTRQTVSPLRRRPVDSLWNLRWPYPSLLDRGSSFEAETFLWRWSGEVVSILVSIDGDGRIQWSTERVGRLDAE